MGVRIDRLKQAVNNYKDKGSAERRRIREKQEAEIARIKKARMVKGICDSKYEEILCLARKGQTRHEVMLIPSQEILGKWRCTETKELPLEALREGLRGEGGGVNLSELSYQWSEYARTIIY